MNAEIPPEMWKVLDDVCKDAPPEQTDDDKEIARLAKLPRMEYERTRNDAAKQLNIRAAILDKLVDAERDKLKAEATPDDLYPHWAVEPWDDPVDTDLLLRAVMERVLRHVFLTKHQAVAVALWVMMTWVHERAAVHSPILLATSAEANSGKSTLLGTVSYLVLRGMLNVSTTGPVLFRSVEKWGPTFLQDEGDVAFVENEDLRAIVNSGWTRGTGILRCDPDTNEPRLYSTFCPKAIGMKGRKLPDTTLSRCIIIEMKRKLPTEAVADFDHIDDEGLQRLRRQCLRWANDNADDLAEATPEVPEGFHNRVRMNWKLLLAIAELAGGTWKVDAWAAARAIEKLRETFDSSIGTKLLADIRTLFRATPGMTCRRSKDLVADLVEMEGSPWVEFSRGKPLTMTKMARLLSGYQLNTVTVHPPGVVHSKGYELAHLEPVFERYLPPESDPLGGNPDFKVGKCAKSDGMGTSSTFQSGQETSSPTLKNDDLSYSHRHLPTCPLQNPDFHEQGSAAIPPGAPAALYEMPDIPSFLDRRTPRPNPPPISAGSDDSLDDIDGRWHR
jgi:putative DNA primase/helicase